MWTANQANSGIYSRFLTLEENDLGYLLYSRNQQKSELDKQGVYLVWIRTHE